MIIKRFTGSAFMLFLLGWYFCLILILVTVRLLLQDTPHEAMFFSPWFAVFTQLTGLFLPLTIWLFFRNDRIGNYLPRMQLGRINIILILALSLFLQPTMMLLSGLASLFLPNPVAGALNSAQEHSIFVLILIFAVTPALIEDIVFRGYILSQYKNISIKKAALINGLFFGIIHLSLHQFAYAVAMGIVFAYFVYYTRSIKAGILSHFVINATQVLLARWAAISAEALPPATELPPDFVWSALTQLSIIMLISLPGVIILFRAFITYNRHRNMRHDMRQVFFIGANLEDYSEAPEQESTKFFDPFFICVIAMFILWHLVFM